MYIEEQEAIERIKDIIEYGNQIMQIENEEEREIEASAYFEEMPFGSLKIILNYISKLQKENEELKELNNAGIEKIRKLEKENCEYFKQLDLDYVDNNFVSKDKIKDKIKEFEKPLLDIAEEQKFPFKYTLDGLSAIKDGVKKVLEELLKE